ncbi:PIN domain-containing protein [Dethiobacter alkaliphilus]|uniref:PIN domain-containing protein n=1 Tax=Dethiobacter alkaliphilus TaxID=427926 RepID=UPI002226B71E|nr:PIN domain-containing protein [Dethiobacter alkaliphilus]MCW3488601.1 PIN domain-containing protein [Dethiobacter alkaliphilus]
MTADNLQFIDSNIVVYAYDASNPDKHQSAGKLVGGLWKSRQGCLSIQVLQEFYVTVTKKVSQPLPLHQAAQIVADLGAWNCHSPTPADLQIAMDIQQRYTISFWDALIITSAKKLKCSTLWSEDINPGQYYEDIEVKNPFWR